MRDYLKKLLITLGIVIIAGGCVALGGWLFDAVGAIVMLVLLIAIGMWYYQYDYNKNKCPLQKKV